MEPEELLPEVDVNGNVTGSALRSECHNGSKILHPVIHLHVFDKDGRLFLQKRPDSKLIQPGKWDTAVGGHISFGESVVESLIREAFEEIGLKDFGQFVIGEYVWESEVEREYVYCFYTVVDELNFVSNEEVADGKLWSMNEIIQNVGKGVFTPNFENELYQMNLDKLV